MADSAKSLKGLTARRLAKTACVAWLAVILLASVFGRAIQRSYDWASPVLPYAALALLLAMLWAFIRFYRRRFAVQAFNPQLNAYIIAVSLAAIATGYLILSLLVKFPIEAAHLLKFAPFAFLVFWACSSTSLAKRFVWSLVLGVGIGCAEETLQIWIPDRFFDWRDIAFNALSGVLGSCYAASLFWGLMRFGPETSEQETMLD